MRYCALTPSAIATPGAPAAPAAAGDLATSRAQLFGFSQPASVVAMKFQRATAHTSRRLWRHELALAAEAEKRVTEVATQAKVAADEARKAAAKFSLWLAASMLAGAFAASLAATEGGAFRDERWYEPGWKRSATF